MAWSLSSKLRHGNRLCAQEIGDDEIVLDVFCFDDFVAFSSLALVLPVRLFFVLCLFSFSLSCADISIDGHV